MFGWEGLVVIEPCMTRILTYSLALLHITYIYDLHLSLIPVEDANLYNFYAKCD